MWQELDEKSELLRSLQIFSRLAYLKELPLSYRCGSGSGPFFVETEARKFYRFRFHIDYLTCRVTWRKIFAHFQMWIKR